MRSLLISLGYLGALVVGLSSVRTARAGYCDNPMNLKAGDLGTQFSVAGKWNRTPTFRKGSPIELHVGRQRGTCGGLEPVPASDVVATAARQGDATPVPLAGAVADGEKLVWTPAEAGVYFLSLGSKDGQGQPDKLVVNVADVPRRVNLRVKGAPKNDGFVTVRLRPPGDAEKQGYALRRWQRVYMGDGVLKSPQPLELADGDYEVDWQLAGKTPQGARWTFRVVADGDLVTTLPRTR